jgi:hypothetical protein
MSSAANANAQALAAKSEAGRKDVAAAKSKGAAAKAAGGADGKDGEEAKADGGI